LGIFRSERRLAISPQVAVSARPSSRPNSVRSSSLTERTIVGHHRPWCVEDPAADLLLLVVSGQEELVEVDDRDGYAVAIGSLCRGSATRGGASGPPRRLAAGSGGEVELPRALGGPDGHDACSV